jgi:two-component system response regulator FixJ
VRKEKAPGWDRSAFLFERPEPRRLRMAFSLELLDFSVETFESGEKLAARPRLPEPACLVFDQRLPGMSGLALVDLFRGRGFKLPAVMIATVPERGVRDRAARAGIPIVEKPLLSDSLVTAIAAALEPPARAA